MTRLLSLSIGILLSIPAGAAVAQEARLPLSLADDQDRPDGQQKPKSPTPTPVDPSQREPGTEPEIKVSLRDGLHFKSADGNFDIIIGGYVGIHYRVTADRPNEDPSAPAAALRSSPDTWYVRQARPEISGFIYQDFDFRVQLDFPTGPAAIDGTLQDCYAGWRYFPEFSLRVGQFKEPFGQEQTTPDRFLDFDERSEGDRFTPQRDLGAEVFGTIGSGFLTYEIGWFNGQGRAVVDTNKGKEEAGRIRFQPFAASDEGFLFKHLRLGVAGTLSSNQKSPITAFNSNSAYLNIAYLVTAAPATTTLDGERTRRGAEFTWNYGPWGARGEVWRRTDTVDTAALDHQKVETNAWSAGATWLVTGDPKPVEGRVIPLHPFDPRIGDWGAFELAARVDRVTLSNNIFALAGAPSALNADSVTGYSAGVNWYLTRNIRISPDVFWEVFDDPVTFANGRKDAHLLGGILRFQLEF
jgi:phosphate-selective porin OprO/OprP